MAEIPSNWMQLGESMDGAQSKLANAHHGRGADENTGMTAPENASKDRELRPTPRRRRVLLCVSGLTPQVITETVYALATNEQWIPHEVHVLTTEEGSQRVRLLLLSDRPGWFRRLLADLALPPIRFDVDTIHVVTGRDGAALDDVRTAADNASAADSIIELVRRFTSSEETELHVSLAGGRKTLGFFAGYALSLLGRNQDRLSHVLVSAPFEGSPEFFYPTPQERIIQVGSLDKRRPADCRDARVTLADIPFVRLRNGIDERLLNGRIGFAEAVEYAQPTFAPAQVRVEVDACALFAGGRRIRLPPSLLAFYLWFARRATQGLDGVERPAGVDGNPEYATAYLTEYERLKGRTRRNDKRLRNGMFVEDFDVLKAKLNKALADALGAAAPHYQIRGNGKPQRFALRLAPAAIEIAGEE